MEGSVAFVNSVFCSKQQTTLSLSSARFSLGFFFLSLFFFFFFLSRIFYKCVCSHRRITIRSSPLETGKMPSEGSLLQS